MMRNRTLTLGVAAAVLLLAGTWVSLHHSQQQGGITHGSVFTDLGPAVGGITEVRLSKGDGSRTTLRTDGSGWTVVERQYPADAGRVRELVLGLVNMKNVEQKTSDPANYSKLGVEAPDAPSAASTLVEVVAGPKTWSLIVGKNADGRAQYVRKPKEAASALVEPAVAADPDQKRWLDRQLIDLPGTAVHDVSVKPAHGAAYSLARASRGDADVTLSPVPKGRNPASSMSLNGQAEALTAFNFDDVHAATEPAPKDPDHATFRTFDGQVFEFTGHKSGEKAFVSVNVSRDEALAKQFAEAPAAPVAPAAAAAPAAGTAAAAASAPAPAATKPTATPPASATPAAAPVAPAPNPAEQAMERLAARGKGVEFEIPLYKYESLFKPQEDLLEPKPVPPPSALEAAKAKRKAQ